MNDYDYWTKICDRISNKIVLLLIMVVINFLQRHFSHFNKMWIMSSYVKKLFFCLGLVCDTSNEYCISWEFFLMIYIWSGGMKLTAAYKKRQDFIIFLFIVCSLRFCKKDCVLLRITCWLFMSSSVGVSRKGRLP